MTLWNTKDFQRQAVAGLQTCFGEANVKNEWDIGKDSKDDLQRSEMYCPRPDIAVGPFNTTREHIAYRPLYRNSVIERLFDCAINVTGQYDDFINANVNPNPRSLLAIEIEKTGNRKHRLGDIANASIVGGIGIVIPLTPEVCANFLKIINFLDFASGVGKLSSRVFQNVLLIKPDDFLNVITRE